MDLRYLRTSQAFINAGMRGRSTAYSRLMGRNCRRDFGFNEAWKIQRAACKSSYSDYTKPSIPNKP